MTDSLPPDLMDRVRAAIAAAAAEEIKPRFGRLAAHDIRQKGPNDLVTVADLVMEHRLTCEFLEILPGSLVVGEEACAEDPAVQERLATGDLVWLVDPIDGTANFARSRPLIAVIVALVRRGETIAGWIHDPLTGSTTMAEKGGGCWQEGRRLTVGPPGPLASMAGTISSGFLPDEDRKKVNAKRESFAQSTSGWYCGGQEYMALCEGSLHFALYGRLQPWDHAAGVFMHAEAGGYSALLGGSPYRPTTNETGLLAAPDAASWRALRDHLLGD